MLPACCAAVLAAAGAWAGALEPPARQEAQVPQPAREFRGVWVATVANIDWPSKSGLPAEQQRAELLALLDRAVELNLNAIVLQVRPACDVFYPSDLEPWSEYLTGQQGKPPEPFYDPLAYAIQQAHRRGLELHAWFNPYRARHSTAKSEPSPGHISRARPELVRLYGRYLWLDPGEPRVQEHSLAVVREVLQRYNVDGIHIDDYFYPYKENGPDGKPLPFPDEPSWQRYQESGGRLARDDWRRENVDTFVQRLHRLIKAEKPWVKFGISPFGIWRPGTPAQIRGFDPYVELYADSRKWLANGWVDYWTPQLYWKIDPPAQSYPVLLKWWAEQNPRGRHLWPGNYTSRTLDGTWPAQEICNQVRVTRNQPGATGNVHFSAKALFQQASPARIALAGGPYAQPALVPASPWLDDEPPRRPRVRTARGRDGGLRLAWSRTGGERVWLWTVQLRAGGGWVTRIVPGRQTSLELAELRLPRAPDVAAVSAVDRVGNKGRPATVRIPGA